MKKTRGQSVSPDKRNVLRCPLSCTASGKKPCSTVVWLFFGVLCLCFLKTFAAPDTVKPKPCELNVTLDESFFLHCYVPDNAIYVHWSRFYTSPKRIEYLYNSKDKRFLKNDTNFTAFPNGTIVFQSANFSDTAEYHCIVLLAGSGDNETKLYVCVQNSSANVANVIPEENPDSKSPDVIGPAVGGGFGALIFCLVIGSLVRYLYKRKRRLASRNNNQEGNDGELKENDITEPLRNRESAKILNCIEATRQSNGTAESPMNGGVSNGLLMVSEGTTQSSGTTKPLIPDGGQH